MEFQPKFHSYNVVGMKKDYWEAKILADSVFATHVLISQAVERSPDNREILPPLQLGDVTRNRGLSILKDIYRLEQRVIAGEIDNIRKAAYYDRLAQEMRSRKQYPLIGSLDQELRRLKPSLTPTANDLMRFGIYTLYLLMCEPERFLVGLKNGVHWKKVNIATNEEGTEPALLNMATHYVPMLRRVGKRELAIVPESLIYPQDLIEGNVRLSATSLPLDEILEDAYFRQRYLVPHEGAEVRFRRAGNLANLVILHSGDEVIAKLTTSYGQEQVILNLVESSYITPDRQLVDENKQSPWATLVAETYHDLVTADELSVKRYKRLRARRDENAYLDLDNEFEIDSPQVIYIPRIVRIKEYVDPRPKYDGPPRPVKPHLVTNHFRTANITEAHMKTILELEKEWGLPEGEIIHSIPTGKTWVRPHFSPKGSEVIMRVGPIFIKRRILAATGLRTRPSFPKSLDE